MTFRELLGEATNGDAATRVAAALDTMDGRQRLAALLGATKRDMRTLWDICRGRRPVDRAFLVGQNAPLKERVFDGKNSMPMWSLFRKHFVPANDGSENVWGFNDQSFAWFSGPGYFVAHAAEPDAPGKYVFDYTMAVPGKPDEWPKIRGNDGFGSRIVYGGMKDYAWAVSDHMLVGVVYRWGKPFGQHFLLCRQESK